MDSCVLGSDHCHGNLLIRKCYKEDSDRMGPPPCFKLYVCTCNFRIVGIPLVVQHVIWRHAFVRHTRINVSCCIFKTSVVIFETHTRFELRVFAYAKHILQIFVSIFLLLFAGECFIWMEGYGSSDLEVRYTPASNGCITVAVSIVPCQHSLISP